MIVYDLKCQKGHTFEGWFNDIAAFEEQQAARMVICPFCESDVIEVAPSVVNVVAPSYNEHNRLAPPLSRTYEFINKHFEDVGDGFATTALRIHHGEEKRRNIRGTTTSSEEERLKDEGVPFVKLSIPKFSS